MDKYAAAIVEYESARVAIKIIKKPLADLFEGCSHAPYMYKDADNCIRLMRKYRHWERYGDNENHPSYGMDEPEFRAPCESCKKALSVFDELKEANKRFGIAKRRLSALAKPFANPKTPDV